MIMIYDGIHIPAAIRSIIGILLADKSKKKKYKTNIYGLSRPALILN